MRGNPNIVEAGMATRFQHGNKAGRGRPVLDPVERMLREEAREKAIAAQWMADLEDKDPEIRLPVRKDLMDRINGKAPQSVNIEWREADPEAEMDGVPSWNGNDSA